MRRMPSLMAGRSPEQLKSDLEVAQEVYRELTTGAKVVSASYTQGAGSRTVTYTPADMGAVVQYIRSLQRDLGLIPQARVTITPRF